MTENTFSNNENIKQELKRPAEEEIEKETKIVKLDNVNISNEPTEKALNNTTESNNGTTAATTTITEPKESQNASENTSERATINNNETSNTNDVQQPTGSEQVQYIVQKEEQTHPQTTIVSQQPSEQPNKDQRPVQSQQQEGEQNQQAQPQPPTILNIANAPPVPPPGMHLLSESQQQQIIQHYVQAQGHDLANFTASSLAQAMVAPIAVPALASNLLQFQNGTVITALPGPPHQLPQPPSIPHPMPEDAQGNKRQNTRNMSNDERRQRRLLRNRQAAKECRKKKKQHIHEMEEKIVQLEQQNALLLKEVEELKNKLNIAAMQGTEGYRLMKEVEELNAKLGMSNLPNSLTTTSPPQQCQPSSNSSSSHDVTEQQRETKERKVSDQQLSTSEKEEIPKNQETEASDNQINTDASLAEQQGN